MTRENQELFTADANAALAAALEGHPTVADHLDQNMPQLLLGKILELELERKARRKADVVPQQGLDFVACVTYRTKSESQYLGN